MQSLRDRPQVLQQFSESVKGWVKKKREEYPHPNDGDAFSHWALELILPELDSDAIFDLLDIAGKNDQGLDAFYRDEQDGVFYLFQAKFAEQPRGANGHRAFDVRTVRELFNAYNLLRKPEAAYQVSERFGQIAHSLQDAKGKNYEIRFCFVLFGWFSQEALKQLNIHLEALDYDNTSYKVYNLDELYGSYLQVEGPQEVMEAISIPFYSYCRLEEHGPEAVVANVNLVQFALNIAPHRPAIYSANVRNPLGYNTVNKVIRKTLKDQNERLYFWHYNNGLTVLCNKVEVDESQRRIIVHDPTIINGCQTMETVIGHLEYLGDIDISILTRFIELPNHRTDALDAALKIARYTNSQTAVIAPDLRSTDTIQTEIKMGFEQLPLPWFYERKRGEWNFLRRRGDIDPDRYERTVKMPDVAQRWYAFDGHPAEAISKKSEMFESDEIYNGIFSPNRTAYEFAVPYLIYETLDNLLKQRLQEESAKTSPNERLIRLTKARTLACAQMLALSRCILDMKYGDYNLEIARFVFEQLRNSASNFVERMFPLLLGCVLAILTDYEEESAHSILRDPATFKALKNEKLPEQLNLAQDTYRLAVLETLPSLND